MRAFGFSAYNQVSRGHTLGVALLGLLVVHAAVGAAVVVWGRRGFESTLGSPGAGVVVIVVAIAAVLGLVRPWLRGPLYERLTAGLATAVPLIWCGAVLAAVDYDAVTGALSATWFGDRDTALWFPGVPLVALGYSVVLVAYTRSCFVGLRDAVPVRGERAAQWSCWGLGILSFAGVVHWATGW